MADTVDKATRSRIMSAIGSTGNRTTELALESALAAAGAAGWEKHAALPGRPDFAFPAAKVCVFVHGCFWHACRKCRREPKSNTAYWGPKLARNRARDAEKAAELRALGHAVLVVWECQLRRNPRAQCRRVLRKVAAVAQESRLVVGRVQLEADPSPAALGGR